MVASSERALRSTVDPSSGRWTLVSIQRGVRPGSTVNDRGLLGPVRSRPPFRGVDDRSPSMIGRTEVERAVGAIRTKAFGTFS